MTAVLIVLGVLVLVLVVAILRIGPEAPPLPRSPDDGFDAVFTDDGHVVRMCRTCLQSDAQGHDLDCPWEWR